MELKDYWKIIRAHWAAIVIITVAGGLVAFGWASMQTKEYTATASGMLTAGDNSEVGSAIASEQYAQSRITSYVDVAKSRTVADIALKNLGTDESPDAVLSRITVTNPVDTATLKVSATGTSPEAARDLAEAWVDAVSVQVDHLEKAGQTNKSTASVVRFSTLDSASLPSSPSFPDVKRVTGIGLLIGLALAFIYAFMRSIFDRRIHSIADVQRENNISVIGTVPKYKGFTKDSRMITSVGGNSRDPLAQEQYSIAEALRDLRTNLNYVDVDNPPRVIVISSPLPGEGKSTVAANLANAIAASGQRVVVVDGDLRRPMVAKTFHLLPGIGLTDVLIGSAKIEDVIQEWGDTGLLFVLGAGKVPPNPSELLGSKAMHKLLQDLAQHAIVIVDAPPLLPVTDAAVLSAQADGALVVTYARKTTHETLKAALTTLERVKARALGVIINGVPEKGGSGEYGYRYSSYAYYASRNEDSAPARGAAQPNNVVSLPGAGQESDEGLYRPRRSHARRSRRG